MVGEGSQLSIFKGGSQQCEEQGDEISGQSKQDLLLGLKKPDLFKELTEGPHLFI